MQGGHEVTRVCGSRKTTEREQLKIAPFSIYPEIGDESLGKRRYLSEKGPKLVPTPQPELLHEEFRQ